MSPDWKRFDAALPAAMATFGMVGAAVAVVNGQGIVHSQTFGVRDRTSGAPVTPNTLFRVGSLTKSMTALLVATLVDDGSYVTVSGFQVGTPVRFSRDSTGAPLMAIEDSETLRWQSRLE